MKALLKRLGLKSVNPGTCTGANGWISDPRAKKLVSYNPANGEAIGSVLLASKANYNSAVESAQNAFNDWRMVARA